MQNGSSVGCYVFSLICVSLRRNPKKFGVTFQPKIIFFTAAAIRPCAREEVGSVASSAREEIGSVASSMCASAREEVGSVASSAREEVGSVASSMCASAREEVGSVASSLFAKTIEC